MAALTNKQVVSPGWYFFVPEGKTEESGKFVTIDDLAIEDIQRVYSKTCLGTYYGPIDLKELTKRESAA